MADDPALRIFPDEFVPNVQSAPYHAKWVAANRNGDASLWAVFRDDVIAGRQVTVPSMATKYGKALIAAGKEHMSISHFSGQPQNPNPPPDPPPPVGVADGFVSSSITAGQTLSGTVPWSITTSGSIASVEFWADNFQLSEDFTTPSPFTYSLDTTTMVDGVKSIGCVVNPVVGSQIGVLIGDVTVSNGIVVPPPPGGTVTFDGNATTSAVPYPFDIVLQAAAGRATSVVSDAGVTPRAGSSRMFRFEIRSGDAPWGQGNACMIIRDEDNLHKGIGDGDDVYNGFSVYFPSSFQFYSGIYNYFFEYHGNTSAVQATVKCGVDTTGTPRFHYELHTQAGFNPQFFYFGNVVRDQWVDLVVRTKLSKTNNGNVTGWMNGVEKFNYTGITLYPGGQATRLNEQIGYYRGASSPTVVMYYSAYRRGTTYAAVDPANYD